MMRTTIVAPGDGKPDAAMRVLIRTPDIGHQAVHNNREK